MKYDHIVVGGGTAGCIVAARLSEDPARSVLLLEAGPDFPDFAQLPYMLKQGWGTVNLEARAAGSPYNWSFTGKATPEQTEPMPVPRGKVLGGSSAINGQTFIRGAPEDYDTWASWGNDGWAYLDCLPYFRRLENDADFHDDFHGTDGPVPVRHHPRQTWPVVQEAFFQAATAAGYPYHPDVNHPEATGVSQRAENNIEGVRMSMALTYIDPVRNRMNLTIRPNVQAHSVMLEDMPEGKRAFGVEVESGGESFVVEGGEIILCAGAVASPQLLMLSGLGPAAQLEAQGIPVAVELPGVGSNMRDHPNVSVRFSVKEGTGRRPRRHAGGAPALHRRRFVHAPRYDNLARVAQHRGAGRRKPHPHRQLRPVPGGGTWRVAAGIRRPAYTTQHGLPLLGRGLGQGAIAGERPPLCIAAATQRLRQHHRRDNRSHIGRPGDRRSAGRLAAPQHQYLISHLRHLQDGAGQRPDGPSSTGSCVCAGSPASA